MYGETGGRMWGLPGQEPGTPHRPVASPVSQCEENGRPAQDLMGGTGQVVQAVSRVIKSVAGQRQHSGRARGRHSRYALDRLLPPVTDVLRSDPTQEKHASYGDPAMNPEKYRFPRMLYGPEIRRARKEIMQEQPIAATQPQPTEDQHHRQPESPRHTLRILNSHSFQVVGLARKAICHRAAIQRTPCVTCSQDNVAPAMFLMSAPKRRCSSPSRPS